MFGRNSAKQLASTLSSLESLLGDRVEHADVFASSTSANATLEANDGVLSLPARERLVDEEDADADARLAAALREVQQLDARLEELERRAQGLALERSSLRAGASQRERELLVRREQQRMAEMQRARAGRAAALDADDEARGADKEAESDAGSVDRPRGPSLPLALSMSSTARRAAGHGGASVAAGSFVSASGGSRAASFAVSSAAGSSSWRGAARRNEARSDEPVITSRPTLRKDAPAVFQIGSAGYASAGHGVSAVRARMLVAAVAAASAAAAPTEEGGPPRPPRPALVEKSPRRAAAVDIWAGVEPQRGDGRLGSEIVGRVGGAGAGDSADARSRAGRLASAAVASWGSLPAPGERGVGTGALTEADEARISVLCEQESRATLFENPFRGELGAGTGEPFS